MHFFLAKSLRLLGTTAQETLMMESMLSESLELPMNLPPL